MVLRKSVICSSLFAPSDGSILDFNERLLDDPSAINTDGYGAGWLFRMKTDLQFLTPDEYMQHLDAGWEKTQSLIKGQYN